MSIAFNSHRESGRGNKNCRTSQETSYFCRHKISSSRWLAAASGVCGFEEGCPWAKSTLMATRFAQCSSFISKAITYGAKATPKTVSQVGKRLDCTQCHFPHFILFLLSSFYSWVLWYNSKDRPLSPILAQYWEWRGVSEHTRRPWCRQEDAQRGKWVPAWEDPRDSLRPQPRAAPGAARGRKPAFSQPLRARTLPSSSVSPNSPCWSRSLM